MTQPLEQVKNENYSDLPYHNKQTEAIQAERAKPKVEVKAEEKAPEATKPVEAPKV